MKSLSLCLVLALAAAACGDDEYGSRNPDATPTADADLSAPDAAPTSTVFAVAGDFAGTGVASEIAVPQLAVTQNAIAGVASDDPVVRYLGGRLYIINRFNHDNITVVDPAGPTLVTQLSTGSGTNPQDVALAGNTLYVAALGAAGVLTVDATDLAGGVTGTIDLSSLDSADGIPDCNSLERVGSTLLVSCGLLDSFVAQGPGVVAMVDTTDDSVDGMLTLTHANPFGQMLRAGDEVLVDTAPSFSDLTMGCVEAIDVSGATPTATGCKIQHTATGGLVAGMAYHAGTLYLAVTEAFGTDGALLTYTGDTLSSGSIVPGDQIPGDVAACPTGEIVYAEGGGYRVLDAAGTELTSAPLDIGLPPVSGGIVCF